MKHFGNFPRLSSLVPRLSFVVLCPSSLVFLFLLPSHVFPLALDFSAPPVCLGSPTTLISLCTPADSILATLWDLDADGKFNDAQGDTIVFLFPDAGTHPVGIQVTTLAGVVNALYKEVRVVSVSAGFTVSNSCLNLPALFHNTSQIVADTASSYTWNFGDGSPSDTMSEPVHTYSSTGIYLISLRVSTRTGCTDSIIDSLQIVSSPGLILTFSTDTSMWDGTTSLEVSAAGQYDSLRWSTGSQTPVITIDTAGSYSVIAWKATCFTQLLFTLTIHDPQQPLIMNLFTPNGDGHNDTWIIRHYELFGTCHVAVYDQWGIQVYTNFDYRNNWDGTSDYGALPTGSYYYVVYYDNGAIYKGTLSLLR